MEDFDRKSAVRFIAEGSLDNVYRFIAMARIHAIKRSRRVDYASQWPVVGPKITGRAAGRHFDGTEGYLFPSETVRNVFLTLLPGDGGDGYVRERERESLRK